MGLFNFLKRKEKKFPKVIIFVGIMGVGKTTLIKNVFRGLHGHEYTLDIEDHSHLIERFAESGNDFSINKYDFKRIKKIRDILKDKTEKKILFDGLLLNFVFLDTIYDEKNDDELANDVLLKTEYFIKKYELEKEELKNILILHINNDNSFEQLIARENLDSDDGKEDYEYIKTRYDLVINSMGETLNKRYGIKYKKVNITNLDVNSESELIKFIGENLLFDNK
ncbi:MAG: AAA family ATPase [Nanoarchaeales archaeon]|nr:AAA family ATPase [Nanoarchaeales archaeon]